MIFNTWQLNLDFSLIAQVLKFSKYCSPVKNQAQENFSPKIILVNNFWDVNYFKSWFTFERYLSRRFKRPEHKRISLLKQKTFKGQTSSWKKRSIAVPNEKWCPWYLSYLLSKVITTFGVLLQKNAKRKTGKYFRVYSFARQKGQIISFVKMRRSYLISNLK